MLLSSLASSQELNEEKLKAFVKSTLRVCISAQSDVATNLQLLDSAWEAQKHLWQQQEILSQDC